MSPCSAWFGYDHFHASFSVINIGVGQLLRNDIAKVINAKVKLLPALSTSFAVFGSSPLTLANNGQTRAVDDEIDGADSFLGVKFDLHSLAAPRKRRVVRDVQVKSHEFKDR